MNKVSKKVLSFLFIFAMGFSSIFASTTYAATDYW